MRRERREVRTEGTTPGRRLAVRLPARHRAAAGGSALALAVPLVLAAVVGAGHAPRVLDERSGGAWVVSPAQGLLSLVDGPTEQVTATVAVPGAGHALSVAQTGHGTYLVDGDAGTVARVDAATWGVATPVALGTPGAALTVLQNDPGPEGPRHVVHHPGSPATSYALAVPTAELSGTGWTIRAIDTSGAPSPVTVGTDAWDCW